MPVVQIPLYQKPLQEPNVALPYYGVSNRDLADVPASERWSYIVANFQHFTNITERVFHINAQSDQYGYFIVNKAMIEAQFMDMSINIYGGWDGADWGTNDIPDDGETTGPITVKDSNGRDWLLYRTDFKGIGDRTFKVFYPGETQTTDGGSTTTPTPTPTPDPEPTTPIYGVGIIDPSQYTEANIRKTLTSAHTYTSGQNMALDLGSNKYGYFAIPEQYNVTFIDIANNYPGGWDGAEWSLEEGFGETSGPTLVTISGKKWKLYRTDYAGLGNKTYKVNIA